MRLPLADGGTDADERAVGAALAEADAGGVGVGRALAVTGAVPAEDALAAGVAEE